MKVGATILLVLELRPPPGAKLTQQHSPTTSRPNDPAVPTITSWYKLAIDVEGYKLAIDVEGYKLAIDVEGYELAIDVEGYKLAIDVEGYKLRTSWL